jgi:hypothetical protein
MPYPEPERYIPLQLRLLASHPALLEGLDTWLKLGLITDREVQIFCQRYLISDLPAQKIVASTPVSTTAATPQLATAQPQMAAISATAITHPASAPPKVPRTQGWVSQFLQSLINEVSVIWLLCLGVFLVVASSAVLAANQWGNLSAPGQYGILLTYTLAFIGASFWTATKPQLLITARMLQVASLLLIPVNFWVMDGFRLLQGGGSGIAMAVVAAVLLSGAIATLMPKRLNTRAITANVLGLSWLHWGWGLASVPVIATYVGCVGTCAILLAQRQGDRSADQETAWWSRISAADIVLPFAVMLLLFRACVVEAVPLEQLGLAFGLCGWLLCWQTRSQPSGRIWALIGLGLLAVGWLVSVGADFPWQAVLVSGLGLWLLGDRLLRHHSPVDLIGLFVVGLGSLGVAQRLIPSSLQEAFIAVCTNWFGTAEMPDVLWSIGLYPYLWGFLGLTSYLRRIQHPKLVRVGYTLIWILGVCLVGLSLLNPGVRSLSLWLALLTLGAALRQQSSERRVLVYITHLLGLAAIFSTVDNFAPQLTIANWGILVVAVMVVEWVACLLLTRSALWQESAWFVGLGLAGLGYLLLAGSIGTASAAQRSVALVIPTALTSLAFFPQFRRVEAAAGLSVVSTIAVQFLTFESTVPRLIGLALGALLMVLNTIRSPDLIAAALSVGFGLTFGYAIGWEVLPLSFQHWVALSVGLLWGMFSLRQGLSFQNWNVSRPFQRALDGWAIALTLWTSLPLAIYGLIEALAPASWLPPFDWTYHALAGVLTVALVYRYWQAPLQLGLVGIAWGVEVTLICTLAYFDQAVSSVAIATLSLGLLTVLLGEAWTRRTGQPYRWSYNLIPLGYGCLGWMLGHTEWTATTGLYTIALAMIGLGIGRRLPALLPITVLGILSISLGSFELVLYPLLNAKGGQPGDGLIILGAVALGLAFVYRSIHQWGARLLNLPPNGLSILGHVHWGLGTFFAIIALPDLSNLGEQLWGAELLLLGGYALWQGRSQQPIWIYAGLLQILMAMGQALYTQLPASQVMPWAGAIASATALAIYSLPWARWGWAKPPFTQVAIALPATVALLSAFQINTSSLLLVGGFYGWIAFATQMTRVSYVGLPAVNWAALKLLGELQLTSSIWSVGLVGLSILFIAQIDPVLQATNRRDLRHLLRCFAVGLVGVTVLYESDASLWPGVVTIGFSLVLVVLGLVLRVRAFLYIGTLTFVFKVLRLIWLFVAYESQTLWILAFIPGVLIIWIAMTFEARRSQVTALLQYWVTALEEWQ